MVWLESLLDSLSTQGFVYSDVALSETERRHWLEVLLRHQAQEFFRLASIGRKATFQNKTEIRNDQISWLQTTRKTDIEILRTLDTWRLFLNRELFLSAKTLEAHFAVYEAGHFYQRHIDQHLTQNSRLLTFVAYLHDSWKPGDGGELVITDGDTNQVKQIIEPLPGRVVIFKSDEIWHEVRKSKKLRYSLTGWFRHDADFDSPPA